MNGAGNLEAWTWTRDDYGHVCAYLGLAPSERLAALFERYMQARAQEAGHLTAWAQRLGRHPRTPSGLRVTDPLTRLFAPTHPIRFALNAVIALHETDANGWRELSQVPTGWRAWASLVYWGTRFLLGAVRAIPWALWHAAWSRFDRGRPMSLRRQTILVTGAARGLGHDVLVTACQQGARVIAVVRDPKDADRLCRELGQPHVVVAADLRSPGALVTALEGRAIMPSEIDIAVMAAGTKVPTTVLDVQAVGTTIQVNFLSVVEFAAWWSRATHPRGLVVVSSLGRWHGMPGTGGYNATKAALSIWADSLALEAPHALQVTLVEPGIFPSAMAPQGRVARLLSSDRRALAARIIRAGVAGSSVVRPAGFTLLTAFITVAGRRIRRSVLRASRGSTDGATVS